jgi:DNA-binding MurR/RpiR family transcriptional regulator
MENEIDAIDKANKMVIFGMGTSAKVGLDIQYKLSRIDIPTFMYLDYHLQITTASLMKKGDVALAISNSGKTKDVIDALKIAKNNGATTINITQAGNSPIHEVSDLVLNTIYVENNASYGKGSDDCGINHNSNCTLE